jgi:poly-gamma-glutamate synthesis protein (capsule biosynthesis protein)
MKLIAVGDLMLGDHPVCFGHGVRSTIESKGFDFIFEDTTDCLKGADIIFGNLETVLSDYNYRPNNLISGELRGSPICAQGLAKVGFSILNLANNHILQHGENSFHETITNLRHQGITPLGLKSSKSKDSEVVFVEDELGVTVALIGFSMRPEKHHEYEMLYSIASEGEVIRQVEGLIAKFDGTVVVSLHWGEEYLNVPSFEQVSFARKLIEKGVSLIIGHHPHVLQGVERYRSGVIVYSLGNFVFDKWQRNPRETAIFSCDISNHGVSDFSMTPVYINRMFQPQIAKGKNARRINEKIKCYSDAIANITSEDKDLYHKQSERAYLKFRIQSYIYFFTNIYRYRQRVIWSSLFRFIKRRFT